MARKRTTSGSDHTRLLRNVPLFSDCTPRELSSIASSGKEVSFPAGKVIAKEGETGVGMHVILEGETKVLVGGRTRRRLGAGAFFGEIALLDDGPRTATVVAETPVRAFVIPSWNFKSILKANPSLSLKMLHEVSRRLRSSQTSLSH
jgi:CRP/FNR family cyclic AMP-dependent transcriptional regulator